MKNLTRAEVEPLANDLSAPEIVRDLAAVCLALMDERDAMKAAHYEELLKMAREHVAEVEDLWSRLKKRDDRKATAEARISRLERVAEAAKAYLDAEDRHANDPDYNTAESLVLTNGVLVHALDALSEPQDGEGGTPERKDFSVKAWAPFDRLGPTSPPASHDDSDDDYEPTCFCACHRTGPRSPSCSDCEQRHAPAEPTR